MNNKLFVGCLPLDLTEIDFKAMFMRFGETTDAIIMTHRRTHVSQGFGYITFLRNKDALKAIAAMDNEMVDGKKRLVTFAKPGS